MRIPFTYFILLLVFIGCKNEDKLTFEDVNHSGGPCDDCPEVTITIPRVLENAKISAVINNALKEEVISLLTFDDEHVASNIEGAIASFNSGYQDLKKMYPDETVGWEAKINAEVSFEDKNMITIKLNSYMFTGGAHGYGATLFLNFDKKKGSELEDWELFNDKKDFQRYAELKFRKQENIPQDKPINSTGYMFEKDSFYLPENIGFTKEGVKLHYNQYEVASYADGPIELTLPYKEVKKYLSGKIKS